LYRAALLDDEEAGVGSRFLDHEQGSGEAESSECVGEADTGPERRAVAARTGGEQSEGREPSHRPGF